MAKEFSMLKMETKEEREKSVRIAFENAKNHKSPITQKFVLLDEYYHNRHYTKDKIAKLAEEKGWDFTPPVLPDPFIQVESQIDPLRPEFTFKGRDNDMDSMTAKKRQDVVEFILYNNNFNKLMPENERHLNKLGTAFWKVSFDGSITGPGYMGDIVIGGPDPANIFPDPSAYCIDDCEFIDYPYRIHKFKAWRMFNKRSQREILNELNGSASHGDTEIYTREQEDLYQDDTYQVIEHWYRDEDGDMACSVQIENKEMTWIPKYWKRTRSSGNKMYPLVEYYKIPDNKSFWGKGEIEAIWDLVDAADREFLMALLHDMFDADDMLIVEEDALKDGTTISKTPGGIIWVKQNKASGVRRLGDQGSNIKALNMINFIHEKIQETNGNFDSAQGKEPIRVTTASGIAQLNERASRRSDVKKADRSEGFRRLYELIDWTALEFYNTDREIMIRGEKETEQDRVFKFNSDNIRTFDQKKYMTLLNDANEAGENVIPGINDNEIAEQSYYYPRIDTEIVTTDGMKQSKAFTTQATTEVIGQLDKLNPAKAELLKSNVELMGLPNEQEIKEAIDSSVQPATGGQPMQGDAHPVDQYFASLTPEQQQQFLGLTPEEQIMQVQQTSGGNV
jgi:hypothetical protein